MWDFPRLLAASTVATFVMAHASAAVLYVDVNSTNPQPPYTTWTTAATNIQDAIDVATAWDFILVTNGVYQTGARVIGGQTNRVALTVPVIVQSVNGADGTIIQGYTTPGSFSGIRCIYMTNGAVLSGFTLTNGAASFGGGGAYCESDSAIIFDCVIVNNSVFDGGAVSGGTLESCLLKGNTSIYGGAARSATLNNCVVVSNACGAGALYYCTANGCIISNNAARGNGGGATGGMLSDCTLIGNSAQYDGGGAWGATLLNCLVASNSAAGNGGGAAQTALDHCVVTNNIAGAAGGGVYGPYGCTLTNCLVAGNYAATSGGGANQGILDHCTVANNSSGALGGGAYSATISQSVISNNYAGTDGGGAFSGTLNNCTIVGNSAQNGGGACIGTLSNCTLLNNIATRLYYPRGGGAYLSVLNYCIVATNSASEGGGVDHGWLNNCIVIGNTAADGGGAYLSTVSNCVIGANWGNGGGGTSFCPVYNSVLANNSGFRGGGSRDGSLNNCTIVGNSAEIGGGASGGFLNNCIVYANSGSNYDIGDFTQLKMSYCCTTPIPTNGFGNITNDPALLDLAGGDLHLRPSSPCINSGKNSYVSASTDFDGNPRIKGGTVDIGAYEFQNPTSTISYAWLQEYGLPIDGTADLADTDHDGMNNWQEWICGTDPTNSLSVLKMFAPSNTSLGLVLSWQSVAGRTYDLQRSDHANPTNFSSMQTNVPGQVDVTTFLDSGTTNISSRLYRVRVQQ